MESRMLALVGSLYSNFTRIRTGHDAASPLANEIDIAVQLEHVKNVSRKVECRPSVSVGCESAILPRRKRNRDLRLLGLLLDCRRDLGFIYRCSTIFLAG